MKKKQWNTTERITRESPALKFSTKERPNTEGKAYLNNLLTNQFCPEYKGSLEKFKVWAQCDWVLRSGSPKDSQSVSWAIFSTGVHGPLASSHGWAEFSFLQLMDSSPHSLRTVLSAPRGCQHSLPCGPSIFKASNTDSPILNPSHTSNLSDFKSLSLGRTCPFKSSPD